MIDGLKLAAVLAAWAFQAQHLQGCPGAGDPAMFPQRRGPQGDVSSICNQVRPMRGGLA